MVDTNVYIVDLSSSRQTVRFSSFPGDRGFWKRNKERALSDEWLLYPFRFCLTTCRYIVKINGTLKSKDQILSRSVILLSIYSFCLCAHKDDSMLYVHTVFKTQYI
jgi:hypothetical protein